MKTFYCIDKAEKKDSTLKLFNNIKEKKNQI